MRETDAQNYPTRTPGEMLPNAGRSSGAIEQAWVCGQAKTGRPWFGLKFLKDTLLASKVQLHSTFIRLLYASGPRLYP